MTRDYLCHPFSNSPANLLRARRWLAHLRAARPDVEWVASWITWAETGKFAGDEEAALDACLAELATCDVITVAGVEALADLTPGQRREHARALSLGLRVECRLMVEPPVYFC